MKHHICDTELSQDALLVLPGCEKLQIHRFLQTAAVHAGVLATIDPARQEDLLEISKGFERYPQFERAAAYYRMLAGVEFRPRLPVQKLGFLLTGGVRTQGLPTATLPERVPQPKPHPLRVRFHRWHTRIPENSVLLCIFACDYFEFQFSFLSFRKCFLSTTLPWRLSLWSPCRRPLSPWPRKRWICEVQKQRLLADGDDNHRSELHRLLWEGAWRFQPGRWQKLHCQAEGLFFLSDSCSIIFRNAMLNELHFQTCNVSFANVSSAQTVPC